MVRVQLRPGFSNSLAGPQCEQGTHYIQDDLHNSITHSAVPSTYRARLLTSAVKVVNSLASRLTPSADRVLYSSKHLVSKPFAGKVVIPSDSSDTLLHAPHQSVRTPAETFLRSPTPHPVRGVFHTIKFGLLP